MEIVDVNFNFEQFEEVIKVRRSKCDAAKDKFHELFGMYEQAQKEHWITKYATINAEAYKMTMTIMKLDMERALVELEKQTEKLEKDIDFCIACMQARVAYIEQNNPADQLYANYKLREERNQLNRKINKYASLKVDYNNIKIQQLRSKFEGKSSQAEPGNE